MATVALCKCHNMMILSSANGTVKNYKIQQLACANVVGQVQSVYARGVRSTVGTNRDHHCGINHDDTLVWLPEKTSCTHARTKGECVNKCERCVEPNECPNSFRTSMKPHEHAWAGLVEGAPSRSGSPQGKIRIPASVHS